jgi:phosphoglucosamine mutase
MSAIKKTEKALGNKGRVLVRYSGTQNMCRVMVEGPTKKETEAHCRRIAEVVKKNLA